tara:strand:+ start:609 stop:1031 length:423 start_codon:yes stop_codon:yes gene_type:complete
MKNNLVKILATLGLIVAIALVLKGFFGVGKIGFENLFGRKICEKVKFTEKKYTGKLKKHFRAPSGETALTYCRNSNSWADLGCEPTPKYKKHRDKYTQCLNSGGRDTQAVAINWCSIQAEDVASEIRAEFYKDCIKEAGW